MGLLDTDHLLDEEGTAGLEDPGFFESISQGYKQQYRVDSPYSLESEIKDRWNASLSQYEQVTGQRPNLRLDLNAFNTYARVTKGQDPSIYQQAITSRGFEVSEAMQQDIANFRKVNEAIKALGNPEIKSFEDVLEEAIKAQQAVEEETGAMAERGGTGDAIGRFIGAVGGSFSERDPITLSTLGLGGFGKTIAARILTEGAVQGAISAVSEFGAVEPNRQLAGLPEGSPWTNVLAAAALGASLRGVGEGLSSFIRARTEVGDLRFDFSDSQMEQMFKAAPQSSTARAGLDLIEGQRTFEAVNPYGETEAGSRRFVAELEEVQRLMAGSTDTAIARFIPDQPVEVQLLDADMELVKAEAPEIHAVYEAAAARVSEIDEQIVTGQNTVEGLTLGDALERIDPETAALVRSYEQDLKNPQLTAPARMDIEQKLEMIVQSIGEERVVQAINDVQITPRKALQQTRQSRKAAVKEYRAAKQAVDRTLAKVQAEQRVKDLANRKASAPLVATQQSDIPLFYMRREVVETQVAQTAAANAVLPDTSRAIAMAEPTPEGLIDLGDGEMVTPDFTLEVEMPDGTTRSLNAAAIMKDLKEDEQLLDAMRTCSL